MKKRNKIIFGSVLVVLVIIFGGILLFLTTHDQQQEEITVACTEEKIEAEHEEEVSKEPELSDVRKELERLHEKIGNKNYQTKTQSSILVKTYNYPFFEDSPKEYSFDDRMELYLDKLEEMAEKEGKYDFYYNAISDGLIWNYDSHKKEISEEDCERFLRIINLCKERLKTADVWEEPEEPLEEPQEEEEETKIIKLTATRKELERLYEERGTYNSRSERENNFLRKNYNIPIAETTGSSEDSFEERYTIYLDKMEALVNPEEWDLLYERISDSLIWDYDLYRGRLTEEQCDRILELIKLCKKYAEETTKKY